MKFAGRLSFDDKGEPPNTTQHAAHSSANQGITRTKTYKNEKEGETHRKQKEAEKTEVKEE